MLFEWDQNKNRLNTLKHGISFEVATLVFGDPNRLEEYDALHSITENRFITIGYANNLIVVVYTIRTPFCRIISARKASKAEERRYYDYGDRQIFT